MIPQKFKSPEIVKLNFGEANIKKRWNMFMILKQINLKFVPVF